MEKELDIDIRFKIVEDKNKYLVQLKQLYKKGVDKELVDDITNRFPINIKDIANLGLEIGYTINRGIFRVTYDDEGEFSIYFIRLKEE